ncbi:glycosyltransferase [Microbacterium neungamense]|uniref:glycosyltransferase n=1 Tax=Microbacterium neungamense TaxID=2810535 RepID=UPI00217E30C7|nr:glycosyltransferase [Microbacterium neungamense]UWF78197.1 glycosyltransferase [Microbacterium neungamense]
MPARVHAILVARPGDPARAQLTRTLDALRRQSTPPTAVTVVVTGSAAALRRDGLDGLVEGVIEARASTSFAEAVRLASARVAEGSAVWLLAQDTEPAPDALQQLAGALERSPSALIAAPKLVRQDDDREIVSLGVSMTRFGRAAELAADELDQGQHDAAEDALAADIRGMLIRAEARDALRPDPALGGADEGLDLGVRARLGGGRVVLVPAARVAVAPDGPAAPPRRASARAWAVRRAQLHRRLAYAPAPAVPLHWLSLLPLALWRSVVHLVGKRPAAVAPEWGAALAAMVQLAAVGRARRAIRSFRRASWASIAPLRVSREHLRLRLDDGHGSERGAVSELHFFSGGGAWAVLAALVVSIACFTPLLAWEALGGGALLPLRDTVGALWADAAWGRRGLGLGIVGPADPFAAVIALAGTLWPGWPSYVLLVIWLLALPLAVLGGWFAATRVTDRAGLRILGGVLWALAPTFLTALVEGRPAAVILHLLLPWLFHTAVVAHRSWGAAGAASLLTAATVACAPVLAPALLVLWLVAVGIALGGRRLRGAVRLIWVLVPAIALSAPLAYAQFQRGGVWSLLADPGFVRSGTSLGADAEGRAVLATGFPSPDRGGWEWFAGPGIAAWVPLLLVPLGLLALISTVSPRWRAGITLLVVAVTGLATAFFAVGVVVSFANGEGVPIWPGTGLSLAWIGIVGAALVALDTALTLGPLRAVAGLAAAGALAVCAVPALLAVHTGHSVLREGPQSTLPAFVSAQARGDRDLGTLVLTPLNDGSLSAELVWGSSETLGAQSTLRSTAARTPERGLAEDAVDLISARDFDAAAALAEDGVSFVLLAQAPGEEDRARALRGSAVTAIDQRPGFIPAGETARGVLWRLDVEAAPRPGLTAGQAAVARTIATVQLVIVFAALLLSVPTRASRRAARSRSRIVGRAPDEPMVLPRRRTTGGAAGTADAVTAQPAEEASSADGAAGAARGATGDGPSAPSGARDADENEEVEAGR